MNVSPRFVLLGLLFCAIPVAGLAGQCDFKVIGALPVSIVGYRALVQSKINGTDATFVVDSGAFFSSLSTAKANEYKLPRRFAPFGLYLEGAGGSTMPAVADVDEFTLGEHPFRNVEFLVMDNEVGSDAVGLLGQNILSLADMDYDFGAGALRFIREKDCQKAVLAYWAAKLPYSVIDLQQMTPREPHAIGSVIVNDKRFRVMFDSGSSVSLLSTKAAAAAGVSVESGDVRATGEGTGIGAKRFKTWVGQFRSVKIGDEEIRNPRLEIADFGKANYDMLLGMDFFLSHHVLIARGQRKAYFTYNGGAVFSLSNHAETAATNAGGDTLGAEGLARRAAVSAARGDLQPALADLTRACELAPDKAQYFVQRSQVYVRTGQLDLARADADHALQLTPDDPETLVLRARLKFAGHDEKGASADLDSASRAASAGSDMHLNLGGLYLTAHNAEAAVRELNVWIAAHPVEVRLDEALNQRCWARALWNQELELGLADCNRALKITPHQAEFLDSRGMLELRLGQFKNAVTDYNEALATRPKLAWSLYGRGLAQLNLGKIAEGNADLAAATTLAPQLAEEAERIGLRSPAH